MFVEIHLFQREKGIEGHAPLAIRFLLHWNGQKHAFSLPVEYSVNERGILDDADIREYDQADTAS